MDWRSRMAVALVVAGLGLLVPPAALADTTHFSGRSRQHLHLTCIPDWGCKPYRFSATVHANVYGVGGGKQVAKAALGFFYSTEALSPDTLLVWGFEFRRRGGPWHRVCVRKRCLFDSRKRAPWPGNWVGSNYLNARIPIPKGRRISEFRIRVVPLTERGEGRYIGVRRTHNFKVRYSYCACPLPSGNDREPAPPPPAEPAPPPPPPQPAPPPPPPPPPPARDICVAHPADPSVVCTRNQGHTVDVCDRDPDGHRAYARVITEESSPGFLSPYYDDNDSKPGCANLHFPSRVLRVAVCVQHEGCSAFKDT